MPFNPAIDPTSANYIFTGMNRQTDATERRKAEMRQTNQQNIQSALGSATDYFAKAAKTGEELDLLNTKMGMFKDAGVIDGDTLDKYLGSSIGAKRAIAGMAETAFARNMKDLPPASGEIAGTDYIHFGNQVVPKSGSKEPARVAVSPQQDEQMAAAGYIYDSTSGKYVPDRSKFQQSRQAPGDFQAQMQEQAKAERLPQLQAEIADLEKKVASDGTAGKWGPDWNPLATSYGDQLAAKQAELATLTGGGAAPGPVPVSAPAATTAAPAAGGGGYQPGKRYRAGNGQVMTYVGGDPSQPTSWQ